MVTYTTVLSHFHHSPLWGLYIDVPEEIALPLTQTDRRVICTINGTFTLHAAIMPDKGSWFIMMNKQTVSRYRLKLGDTISVQLEKDTSTYGMPLPEELEAALVQGDEAWEIFNQKLTPGKQRMLIYIVAKVKNTESRIKKALAIAHHLNESKGNIDGKRLNELIKQYNNNAVL